MKKTFFLLLLITCSAFANRPKTINVEIVDIQPDTDKYSLAYGIDGRIYRIKKEDAFAYGKIKTLLVEQDNEIIPLAQNEVEAQNDYRPTNLTDIDQANNLFKSMVKKAKKKSQCYMRAHAWVYDLHRYHGVNSEKIFIFFTKKYISKYRFKWWFHVAPMVTVNGEKMVMDRKYAKEPLSIRAWTDTFMKNDSECLIIPKYDSYIYNNSGKDCLLRITPMYFWSPISIKQHDDETSLRNDWRMGEVKASMRKAFKGFPNSI